MAHRRASFGEVYFVRWASAPIPSELAEIEPDVEKADERVGKKLTSRGNGRLP